MIRASLQQLHKVIAGSLLQADVNFTGLSTDSRQVVNGNVFLALRGEHFDAHNFLLDVQAAGAVAVIVEHAPNGLSIPALVVPNTKQALMDIGRFCRQQFDIPVIGVTGSNGKTTVKEMIASILAAQYGENHRLATKGNLNNEIGVPLTLMRLSAEHRAAVVELGMNHPGEIALLSSIAAPTVGLVNNAQREHQEFMHSVEAVAKENGAVIRALPAQGVAVFPENDPFTSLWRDYAKEVGAVVQTFGLNVDADVYAQVETNSFGSQLLMHIGDKSIAVRLAAAGQHNVLNALAAAACCSAIGVNIENIAQGLGKVTPVAGRLQAKRALGGAMLIDDTYNANPDSVKAAIDVLVAVNANNKERTYLVLGDMGEVGNDGAAFHHEIGTYAKERGVAHVYTLGKLAQATTHSFGEGAQHFDHLDAMLNALQMEQNAENIILVKGSRFMKMERVVAKLMDINSTVNH